MGFLQDKRILITGVASNRSIAWGTALAMHREGAQLAFTYQTEKLRPRVEALAARAYLAVYAPQQSLGGLVWRFLSGGGPAAAACHVARTTVRRAERRVTALAANEAIRPEAIRYLNRLSDLLFVIARVLARAESGEEVLWKRNR